MTDTEETLRYWLAQEDVYPSRYTQNFLKNTSDEAASDILGSIAWDAEPMPHSYLELLWTAFATIGFLPSGGGKIPRRKAGVRAALMLPDRNDARCVAPLVRVFETESVWQSRYQTQIVSALTHFFSRNVGKVTDADIIADAEVIAGRVWRFAPRRDLPEAWARLAVAALSFVHAADAGGELLDAVAGAKVAALPNRAGIQGAVSRLLEGRG